jgi:hypothetical protein
MPPPPQPSIPTNLRLESRGSNSLVVEWDNVTNADFYELEVSSSGVAPRVFQASSPQKIENLLSSVPVSILANRPYLVRVRAVKTYDGSSRVESNWSPSLQKATLPPKPLAPSASSSMIEVDIKLSWDVQLSNDVDTTNPLFVEVRQENSTTPIATSLPLKGTITDTPSLGKNSYSDITSVSPPRNESEWSEKIQLAKDIFAKMEVPGTQMNQKIRVDLIKRYYGN